VVIDQLARVRRDQSTGQQKRNQQGCYLRTRAGRSYPEHERHLRNLIADGGCEKHTEEETFKPWAKRN